MRTHSRCLLYGALFFHHGPALPSTMPQCRRPGQGFQIDFTCCSLSPGKFLCNLRYTDVQSKHLLIITHQRINVITLFIIYLVCVYLCGHAPGIDHVEARGQLVEISSLLLPHGSCRSNSSAPAVGTVTTEAQES